MTAPTIERAGHPEEVKVEQSPKESSLTANDAPTSEDALDARLERLGRQRPDTFRSVWAELGFCYSILASQFMAEYFVSGFNVLLPTLITELDIPQAAIVWPSGAFALVTSAFLLPFGRLADMYGGYPVYIFGLAWFCLWSVIAGFAQNELMLDFCRALQGLGPAAFLSSGVMLLGSIYRPGPRKNMVFSIYGAAAPLGFFFGVFIAGVAGSFLSFGWYFWIGAILIFTTFVTAVLTVPSDLRRRPKTTMDWSGSALLVAGLVLVVFALTDGSHAPQGWQTPYIYVTFILGLVSLGSFIYVEGWMAKNPLIPPDLFRTPYLKPLFIGLFFSYGCLGTFLLYATLYMQNIMGASPIQVAAWFVPMCAGGVFLSVLGGYVLHLVPGTILIVVSGLGWVATSLLFALAPPGAKYWAFVFPAMCAATIGIDIIFNVANIFITTNLSSGRQGLAGALSNALLYLGIAVFLAFADLVQTRTVDTGLLNSYRNVFWYQLGCSVFALALMTGLVRIKKARSELTFDERVELEQEARGIEMNAPTDDSSK
ncbi:MAG: hypothetical protein M1817_005887 [Caeruleum heppii]|nr:MAG: hypothetical protein M1817_005887 [Caeruleum heppii]